MTEHNDSQSANDFSLAIIGMSGRFPGAADVDALWQMLAAGRKATTYLSDEELLEAGVPLELINDPNYVKASMVMDEIDQFDASFLASARVRLRRWTLRCACSCKQFGKLWKMLGTFQSLQRVNWNFCRQAHVGL